MDEIEVSLKKLTENQVVQGEMLNRLEQVVARNSEAIAHNTEAIGHLADGMQGMQAAMGKLFDHMERFIRGLEGNGFHQA